MNVFTCVILFTVVNFKTLVHVYQKSAILRRPVLRFVSTDGA